VEGQAVELPGVVTVSRPPHTSVTDSKVRPDNHEMNAMRAAISRQQIKVQIQAHDAGSLRADGVFARPVDMAAHPGNEKP
jgi:hypothetical protein